MMEQITVKKIELLKAVKDNRDQHKKVFEEALIGYQAAVIEHLEKQLERARQGVRVETRVALYQPVDQTKDYDRVIRALEMSTEDEIDLSEREFAQYVMDDWSWSDQFWASNSVYSATARSVATDKKLL